MMFCISSAVLNVNRNSDGREVGAFRRDAAQRNSKLWYLWWYVTLTLNLQWHLNFKVIDHCSTINLSVGITALVRTSTLVWNLGTAGPKKGCVVVMFLLSRSLQVFFSSVSALSNKVIWVWSEGKEESRDVFNPAMSHTQTHTNTHGQIWFGCNSADRVWGHLINLRVGPKLLPAN